MNIVVAPDYQSINIQAILQTIHTQGQIEYQGRNTIKSIQVAENRWNIKLFKIPHIFNQYTYRFLRKSKAQRSFEYAHLLIEKGFHTPRPIAFAEQHSFFRLRDSYYITEHLTYQLTFRDIQLNPDYPDRKRILQQFTAFTYRLQMKGIHFIDHSPGNTLILKQGDKYTFYLVDLNRMAFGPLNYQQCIENFTRLSLTEEMIKVMASTYAMLCNKEPLDVFIDMREACQIFVTKREQQKALKNKLRRIFSL